MANVIKRAVFNLMDKAFTNEGYVVGIRTWLPATMYEIDLHLPGVDMTKWKTIPRLKCKVAEYEYRDYTPAKWDAEKCTCTMLIETEHTGYGSSWAKSLQIGDTILCAAAHAAPVPANLGKIICFGDGSSAGHFLALKQLTEKEGYALEAVISLNGQYTLPDDFLKANPQFEFIMSPDCDSQRMLSQFAENIVLKDFTSIYLAGYIPMVQGLRKIFKKIPDLEAKIYAQGFWS